MMALCVNINIPKRIVCHISPMVGASQKPSLNIRKFVRLVIFSRPQ